MMNIRAVSIGEAVPRRDFGAVIHSAFDSAVNLRLEAEDRLITLLNSEVYELPQGIRVWTKDLPLKSLTSGLRASGKGGILRFDSSSLTVDLRGAPVWKCRVPELGLDMTSPVAREAWSTAWELLNKEQKIKNADILADVLFRLNRGSPLSQRISKPFRSLVASTRGFDMQGAVTAAKNMIGLGPGVTPSGDDILIGFLAGLWSVAGQNQGKLAFLHSFGAETIKLARQTSEISRTYIYHAAQGQFSSALSNLAEAIATNNNTEEVSHSAMQVGHSSGMDSGTGLLIGLRVWDKDFRT